MPGMLRTVPLGRGIVRKVVRLPYVEACILHHGFCSCDLVLIYRSCFA